LAQWGQLPHGKKKENSLLYEVKLIGVRLTLDVNQNRCEIIKILHFEMYMSYRWRESFNTHNRQIRDVITTGIDMRGRRMRKGGGDRPYIRRGAD